MPVTNKFDRTALFVREPMADGKKRIRRLPWDLISAEGMPFMVSPVPVNVNFDTKAQTATFTPDIADMLSDPDADNQIDNVTGMQFFSSESEFNSIFDGAFGFYITDSDQSTEFGFPRS
jgi:hypothetical protein